MSDLAPTSLTQLPEEADRRLYSKAELQNYLARINFPPRHLNSPVLSDSSLARTKEHGLPLLEALCRHHTTNIPFENLLLHYSADKKVVLELSHLYTWFVTKRRGGRCMENNSFFGTVLRSLGYTVRNCGGRVSRAMSPFPEVRKNQADTYDGLNHMLNLVRFENEWYVVDVGMGAMGPNMPYPLRHNFSTTSISPRRIRIQHRAISESYAGEAEAPKLWCYDVCHDPTHGEQNTWTPTYCFTEMEFLPQDYEVMSWFTSTHANSFFTRYMTATRMIMDAEQENIVGSITLFKDTIREQRGSERKLVEECKTEIERVQALKDIFGIELTGDEREALSADFRLA
ncbi:cysteine proteinase, partial [Aureobasidium melanogenum]